jgi:hypothetical protein
VRELTGSLARLDFPALAGWPESKVERSMADFVEVLKKTIDGLGDTTPQVRARVYEKARLTVAAKLAAINPPPSAAVVDRQKKSLEDAIAEVEAQYAPPAASEPEPVDELEDVFAALDDSKPVEAVPATTAGSSFEVKPVTAAPVEEPDTMPSAMSAVEVREAEPRPIFRDPDAEDAADEDEEEDFQPPPRRRGIGGIVAALIALALLGGGGYAAWLNKDQLSDMLDLDKLRALASKPAQEATPQPEKPQSETAAVTPKAAPAESPEAPAQPEKFTQRLNTDGTEVDEGPGSGAGTIGEGTSVAAVTQPPEQALPAPVPSVPAAPAAPADSGAAGSTPAPEAPAVQPALGAPAAQPAVAVGQKAIFYEERTNNAQGSADTGSIVWSVVQESPGGDLPPEPAIRAEATIPGKDLQLRMTIRRNADPTLPASHIIEMIFLTPEGFEGGGIENILRVSLKDSEQAAGSALLGIPAKIADGFFLVALNESKPEMDANLNLLSKQQWIDVPLVYKSGRRALITMEKGIPGDKVFEEAMKAWQANAAGSAG